MAKKKSETDEKQFQVEQILNSKLFEKDIDILKVILKEGKAYTVLEINQLIQDFKEREVQ